MSTPTFHTAAGAPVPAVTTEEMRAVDRVATDEVGLSLVRMMENAGRSLAWHAREPDPDRLVVLAGDGGNGGGGLVCARHLANHGVDVRVVLDRTAGELPGVTAEQYVILDEMGVRTTTGAADGQTIVAESDVVVDALVGYGITGGLREPARSLVAAANDADARLVSLDVPSGIDATTGEADGVAAEPDLTVTLALPKTGLADRDERLFLADISVPGTVYERVGIEYEQPFDGRPWVELDRGAL